MRGEASGFLARIRERPNDDGPRLIYADWLDEQGDPRGEFIRVQLALARLPEDDRRRAKLRHVERDLLGRYADLWSEPFRGLATGPVFSRGFVEEVKVTARQLLAYPDALFAAGPVSHLHLLDLGSHLVPALALPQLLKLSGLTVFAQHLGPPLARAVAESPFLANLTEMRLARNRLGDDGAECVAASPHLANLEVLDLGENELGEAAARALAGSTRLGRLRRLEVGGNAIGPAGAVAVMGVGRADAGEPLHPGQALLLRSLLDQCGLALSRIVAEEEARALGEVQERDRLRAALLSSVSHDLRTPLTTVLATLRAMRAAVPEQEAQLAAARTEAERLNRFVANLLDMVRI